MPSEGSTRTGILPGRTSLDRGSRVAEVGFEPRTFRCKTHVEKTIQFYHETSTYMTVLPYNSTRVEAFCSDHHHRQHDISVQHRCFTAVQPRPI
ncbi:hypothetical protein T265_06221 [Opisthorchis viverrini]|uniref:Uncharacterized protein n=1 Tax=Opisthorchis viverrini TaxID=6198 RepID=A0A074ZH92_OPIVI|nr:hypothetical protein T265_06221 [Opisthorchis viverrini]KER26578.1 hypothetical protein T265_06221 [Opisthorchis viverrini]